MFMMSPRKSSTGTMAQNKAPTAKGRYKSTQPSHQLVLNNPEGENDPEYVLIIRLTLTA